MLIRSFCIVLDKLGKVHVASAQAMNDRIPIGRESVRSQLVVRARRLVKFFRECERIASRAPSKRCGEGR